MEGLKAVVLMLLLSVAVTQAAVFGMSNVMYKRYPNGPKEMFEMDLPELEPRIASQPVPEIPSDSSWMFRREGNPPAAVAAGGRKLYYVWPRHMIGRW